MAKMEENAMTGFVYFLDDTELGQLRSDEDRRMATYDEIPKLVKEALIAVEDSNFYDHIGFDFKGVFRAVKQKVLNEDIQTGGSTITQQLSRRVFLNTDREISRKLKEILLSVRIERVMSKDQIITAYLNKVPFGTGANGYNVHGIKAAAKGIFGIENLNELNLAQSAYLAGLPQLPSSFSAFKGNGTFDEAGFNRAVERQHWVLKRMVETEKITNEQYEEALSFNLKESLSEPQVKAYTTYPNLMIEVEKRATEVLLSVRHPEIAENKEENKEAYQEAFKETQQELFRGGYKVYTTIDQTLYDAMQAIANDPSNFLPDHPEAGVEQVGAIMIDNRDGAILGMIEGRGTSYNHATQAYRQPGSAMKPIAAFLPALEKGAIQPGGVIDDSPIVLKDGTSGWHIPENWNRQFQGLITAREALNQSYNIPAIKLFLNEVGIQEAWDFARQLGINSITEEDNHAQTGVIGGLYKGVSVEELTNAYTAIANKGAFNDAYMIRRIESADGKMVYEHETKPTQVFSEETAYLMTDMLRTVITSGTGTNIKKYLKNYGKFPISGKTGTTNEDADAWFVGYSPDITVGVWAGYSEPKYKLSSKNGSTMHPLQVWSHIMDVAYEKKPELFQTEKFEQPKDIVKMTVSNLSGKLPTELTTSSGHLVTDIFNRKYVPTEVDDVLVRSKYITYNGVNYLPHSSTPDDMVREEIVIKRPESVASILKRIQEVSSSLPANKRRSLSAYVPKDAYKDAPTETDPRQDDGKAPEPPSHLVFTRNGDTNSLSFNPSGNNDVVGYRLYRTDGVKSFERMNGKVILAGEETLFTGLPYSFGSGYYITAVDVAGRESAPSRVVFNDSINPDLILPGEGRQEKAQGEEGSSEGAALSPPSGVKASMKGKALQITWNHSKEKASQYNIYYSEKESGPFQKIGSIKGDTEFNFYASESDDYNGYYRVTASNGDKESKPTAPVHFES
ncbi:transglycosylase domain-containing protein [Paenibacillus sp. J2TS4]|uniref:transglycosylase domain-containing protein n=1 Tax=Paenibacillus sp. J2TS4 TaxID=2807194 RepID=UPI001B06BC8E|nr:transglycosylase domain-containing protein [Paenibacillus sp. J2TS4]GIP32908.1 hypothetical protein J2TS4_21180 [Paenibacillus sp. J2TS4]